MKVKDNDYQLVLTSSETGLENQMSVSVQGDDKLNQFISFNNPDVTGNNVEQIVEAQDAKLSVNGLISSAAAIPLPMRHKELR